MWFYVAMLMVAVASLTFAILTGNYGMLLFGIFSMMVSGWAVILFASHKD